MTARELAIQPSFIKDYLATHTDLDKIWAEKRFVRLQEQYRENFLRVLENTPSLPIKKIRRIPGNGFQWLYNNDLEWLHAVLPAIWRRP